MLWILRTVHLVDASHDVLWALLLTFFIVFLFDQDSIQPDDSSSYCMLLYIESVVVVCVCVFRFLVGTFWLDTKPNRTEINRRNSSLRKNKRFVVKCNNYGYQLIIPRRCAIRFGFSRFYTCLPFHSITLNSTQSYGKHYSIQQGPSKRSMYFLYLLL